MRGASMITRAGGGGTISVSPASRLRGTPTVPGDKSISHRALMLALLARGDSVIVGAGDGADVRSTARILGALGANVTSSADVDGRITYRVESPGADDLTPAPGTLDCGNSGTSLRLFAGLLAGLPVSAVLDGDGSLRSRPMNRIIEPLRTMGADVRAGHDDGRPPLHLVGRGGLRAIDWATATPSAQVKSAILLAGLRAIGTTRVRETVATRDHTERMLRARGIPVRTRTHGGDIVVEIDGGIRLAVRDERVPGDPSAAAFWLVAAAIHPDAQLSVEAVATNPTRRAVIDLLRRMGADIQEQAVDGRIDVVGGAAIDAYAADGNAGEIDGAGGSGEPVANLTARSSDLRAIEMGPDDVAAAIDEIPILCLAATQAVGRTLIRGAAELRNKESDRLAGIATGLAALGARIRLDGDDIIIDGPTALRGGGAESLDDHRLAMTFAIAGLIARDGTAVGTADSVAISYPSFFGNLERIRA